MGRDLEYDGMGVKVFKAYNMDKFEEKEYYMEIGLGRTWSLRGR